MEGKRRKAVGEGQELEKGVGKGKCGKGKVKGGKGKRRRGNGKR